MERQAVDRQRKVGKHSRREGSKTEDQEINMVSLWCFRGIRLFGFSRCSQEHEREESAGSWSLESSLQDLTVTRMVSAVRAFS